MSRPPMFRETLWFKCGELGEPESLPVEDRYLDDGHVNNVDTFEYGIHCGETALMPVLLIRARGTAAHEQQIVEAVSRELVHKHPFAVVLAFGASIAVAIAVLMAAF